MEFFFLWFDICMTGVSVKRRAPVVWRQCLARRRCIDYVPLALSASVCANLPAQSFHRVICRPSLHQSQSAWVECMAPFVCLFICLSTCLFFALVTITPMLNAHLTDNSNTAWVRPLYESLLLSLYT